MLIKFYFNIKMERPSKIKSPKSGRMIIVGKGEYNKLLSSYSENYLLSLGTIDVQPLALPEDVIYTIILHSDVEDIINLYDINKTYRHVLNKPHVLKELSAKYLNQNATTFDEFLNLYIKDRSNHKLNLNLIYQLMKKENAAITINYARQITRLIEKLIELLYDQWSGGNYWKNGKYRIPKGEIIDIIKKDKALSKYFDVKHVIHPFMTHTIRDNVSISQEDIDAINQVMYPIMIQFAKDYQKDFKQTVKKILTRKYERLYMV